MLNTNYASQDPELIYDEFILEGGKIAPKILEKGWNDHEKIQGANAPNFFYTSQTRHGPFFRRPELYIIGHGANFYLINSTTKNKNSHTKTTMLIKQFPKYRNHKY